MYRFGRCRRDEEMDNDATGMGTGKMTTSKTGTESGTQLRDQDDRIKFRNSGSKSGTQHQIGIGLMVPIYRRICNQCSSYQCSSLSISSWHFQIKFPWSMLYNLVEYSRLGDWSDLAFLNDSGTTLYFDNFVSPELVDFHMQQLVVSAGTAWGRWEDRGTGRGDQVGVEPSDLNIHANYFYTSLNIHTRLFLRSSYWSLL